MQRASANYIFGRFHLDAVERRLTRDGEVIPLTPKAFEVLVTLLQRAGHVVTKDELMRAVWPDGFVEDVNLAYNISVLRKALADGRAEGSYIETVPKLGYRFVAPVEVLETASPTRPRRGNLPAQLTRFIGREREIVDVLGLLAANRLVTLTGSGGVGKSRLGLEVAMRVEQMGTSEAPVAQEFTFYPDGIWLVELASLSDQALVPQAVATALGLLEGVGGETSIILIDFLREKRALLLLDNCEHLIEACALLADEILRACPRLSLLATSRQPLRVAGEAVHRVPSLTYPDMEGLPALNELSTYDSVRLFAHRAAMVVSSFEVTLHNASAVANVCRRLDGIPLAIELAAARVNALSVEEIAERLDDCLSLLTLGSRAALPRHQTLRAALAWSFDLLSVQERDLLMKLSIFADGFTIDAAEAISGQPDALHRLMSLVDKSLVIADVWSGVARYHLLEIIRQFALEQLRKSGMEKATRQRHLDFFLGLAESAEPELRRTHQIAWLDRLQRELGNLRAALAWALDEDRHPRSALHLATRLLWFWHSRDHNGEGSEWLARALEADARALGTAPMSPDRALARSQALNALAFLVGMHGNAKNSNRLAEEALALARASGEAGKQSQAFALLTLAAAAYVQQQSETSRALAAQSFALYSDVGDLFGMAESSYVMGRAYLSVGDLGRAKRLYEQDLALRDELGDIDGHANSLRNLGDLQYFQGDLDQADAIFQDAFARFTVLRSRWPMCTILFDLTKVALAKAEFERADGHAQQGLALAEAMGDEESTAFAHLHLGKVAQARGEYGSATTHARQALHLFRKVKHSSAPTDAYCLLGAAALAQEQPAQAAQQFGDALAFARNMGGRFSNALALSGMGQLAHARGDHDQARALWQEALALWRGTHLRPSIGISLDALACVAAAQDQAQLAAQLFGSSASTYRLVRWTQSPFEREVHEHSLAAARAVLGDAEFEAAYAEGQRMTLDEAVEYALSGQSFNPH